MTIEIKTVEKGGNTYKNLKFSKTAMPLEYAVVEKVYDEAMTGESQYGKWYNFLFRITEIKSMDPETGKITVDVNLGEASMMTTEKLYNQLNTLPTDTAIKIRKEIVNGKKGDYTVYKAELLSSEGEEPSTKQILTPEAKDNAEYLMKIGIDKTEVAKQVSEEHNLEVSEVLSALNNLPTDD